MLIKLDSILMFDLIDEPVTNMTGVSYEQQLLHNLNCTQMGQSVCNVLVRFGYCMI